MRSVRSRVGVATAAALLVAGSAALAPTARAGSSPNLLTGQAATFDGGTGGWSCLISCQVAEVSQPVHSGTGALEVRSGGTSPRFGSGPVAAVPGDVYSGVVYVRAGLLGHGILPLLLFANAQGASTGAAAGQPVTDGWGWVATAPVAGIAPPGTTTVRLAFDITGSTSGDVHYIDDASLVGRQGRGPAITGPLHTTGNQVLDSGGRPLVLRGLNRYGATGSSTDLPTDGEVGSMQGWGANFVRLPLSESFWVDTCPAGPPTNDPNYPARIDAAVASITSRGMVALLDLHTTVTAACGAPGQQKMADAAFAPTFWAQLAARYRTNPLVAFDLFNEPHDISDVVWHDGGRVADDATTYRAAGMQDLYDTVRAQGATNLVFVSGLDWAARPSALPITGTGIVDAAHAYTCPWGPPPTGCTTLNVYDPGPILAPWLTAGKVNPVVVTEFGWPASTDGTYAANVVAYAAQQGWGWAAWAWDGHTTGLFDLVADTSIYEPAPSGMPILAGLGANLG